MARVDVVFVDQAELETTLRALLPAAAEIVRTCEHCGHPTHGRPRVPTGEISFSVSHSDGQGVIAVAFSAVRIGVDLERVRDRPYLDRLAARTLTPEALAEFQRDATPAQFLRAWTMKEAYLKATGIGIATTLAEVPEQPAGWTVRPIDAPAGYVAAIAVETEDTVIVSDGTAS